MRLKRRVETELLVFSSENCLARDAHAAAVQEDQPAEVHFAEENSCGGPGRCLLRGREGRVERLLLLRRDAQRSVQLRDLLHHLMPGLTEFARRQWRVLADAALSAVARRVRRRRRQVRAARERQLHAQKRWRARRQSSLLLRDGLSAQNRRGAVKRACAIVAQCAVFEIRQNARDGRTENWRGSWR
eukprot:6194341-Pleurochrysis_carterae.AAC.2